MQKVIFCIRKGGFGVVSKEEDFYFVDRINFRSYGVVICLYVFDIRCYANYIFLFDQVF